MVPARWGRQIESSAPARPTPSLSWMASWSEDIPLSLLTPMFARLILGRRSPEVLFSPNHKEKSFSPSSLTKFPSLVSTLIRCVTIPSRCRQRRQASRVRCLKAAQCSVEMSQSSPSMWGDVSKQPTVEMWATHWVIVSPNDAIPGKRETESLPYLILNTYLQARNGLTDDSFGVIQAVSNIFHLWSEKKRQKGVWTLVRLRFREYARQRPARSDTLYPPSPLP